MAASLRRQPKLAATAAASPRKRRRCIWVTPLQGMLSEARHARPELTPARRIAQRDAGRHKHRTVPLGLLHGCEQRPCSGTPATRAVGPLLSSSSPPLQLSPDGWPHGRRGSGVWAIMKMCQEEMSALSSSGPAGRCTVLIAVQGPTWPCLSLGCDRRVQPSSIRLTRGASASPNRTCDRASIWMPSSGLTAVTLPASKASTPTQDA